MAKFPHLAQSGSLSVAKEDFAPFPSKLGGDWLERLMEEITVRHVSAIHHRCKPHWRMVERRVLDDMFFYITHGQGEARVEDRKVVLAPGVCAHFRRGLRHSATTDPKDPIHVIALHYTATVFESLTLPELLNFPDAFDLARDKKAEAMFHDSCREYALRPAGYQRGLEAVMVRLLFHLIREHGDRLNPQTNEVKLADLRRLLPALEAMGKNLSKAVFIPDLARLTGFSEAQFRRVFQRTMGVSPVQRLRSIRMERACQLLRQTDQTVEAIASEVGYAEPAFFAHSFKKLIGISPGRYRSTHEL